MTMPPYSAVFRVYRYERSALLGVLDHEKRILRRARYPGEYTVL